MLEKNILCNLYACLSPICSVFPLPSNPFIFLPFPPPLLPKILFLLPICCFLWAMVETGDNSLKAINTRRTGEAAQWVTVVFAYRSSSPWDPQTEGEH